MPLYLWRPGAPWENKLILGEMKGNRIRHGDSITHALGPNEVTEIKPGDTLRFAWVLRSSVDVNIEYCPDVGGPKEVEEAAWREQLLNTGGMIDINDCEVVELHVEAVE